MCLGSDARLLVLTARRNDVQGALMANSTKQLRLTAQAEELSAERTAALNATQWTFNGSSEFDYNTLMNNGYFVVSPENNNKVVLNSNYYKAATAADINQKGGEQGSIAGLDKFMQALGVKPSSKGFDNWIQVKQGQTLEEAINQVNKTNSEKRTALETAKTNFINTYGAEAPQQGTYVSGQEEVKTKKTNSRYFSGNDGLKNFANLLSGNVNMTGGQASNASGYTINNLNNHTWAEIMDKSNARTVLVLGSDYKTTITNVVNDLGNKVKAALPGFDEAKLNNAVTKTINHFSRLGDNSNGGSIAGAANHCKDCGCAGKQYYGTVRAGGNNYVVDLKSVMQMFLVNIGFSNSSTCDRFSFSYDYYETSYKDIYDSYKNDKGKTYEQWHAAYNKLSDEVKTYMKDGSYQTVKVDENADYLNKTDRATLAKYEGIYNTICSQGWTYDEKVENKNTLTQQLENNKYLLQKLNGTPSSIKSFDDFSQVKADTKAIEAYYDGEELKIKNQEKRLSLEQSSLQTELSAIETETQSVQSILDKNIERSFNIFG